MKLKIEPEGCNAAAAWSRNEVRGLEPHSHFSHKRSFSAPVTWLVMAPGRGQISPKVLYPYP